MKSPIPALALATGFAPAWAHASDIKCALKRTASTNWDTAKGQWVGDARAEPAGTEVRIQGVDGKSPTLVGNMGSPRR